VTVVRSHDASNVNKQIPNNALYMASIDDIWDEPIVASSPRPRPTAINSDDDDEIAPRRSKRPLFLEDSDDEQPPVQKSASDIDALFADVDDDDFFSKPLSAAPDLEAIRREAAAKHTRALASLTPHEILPSSSPARDLTGGDDPVKEKTKDGKNDIRKKERKKVPRLDEGRLLGADGFPQLIKDTKHFKPKGKGHEV
jgi:replication fork protection complex subunit Csm3/Swi3